MTFNELQHCRQCKGETRTEPCGTPKRTADDTELDVVVQTCCFLLLRYDVNQSINTF